MRGAGLFFGGACLWAAASSAACTKLCVQYYFAAGRCDLCSAGNWKAAGLTRTGGRRRRQGFAGQSGRLAGRSGAHARGAQPTRLAEKVAAHHQSEQESSALYSSTSIPRNNHYRKTHAGQRTENQSIQMGGPLLGTSPEIPTRNLTPGPDHTYVTMLSTRSARSFLVALWS